MKEFNDVKYYDVKEVAERIGVTTRTINRYQEKFDVHPTFIGQQKYFTEENIQQTGRTSESQYRPHLQIRRQSPPLWVA